MFPAIDRNKILQFLRQRNRQPKPEPGIMPDAHYTTCPGNREADICGIIKVDKQLANLAKNVGKEDVGPKFPNHKYGVVIGIVCYVLRIGMHMFRYR